MVPLLDPRRGLPSAFAGVSRLVGFHTTRFIEASDPSDAETRALESQRGVSRLAPPPGHQPSGAAGIDFEEISELPGASVPDGQLGFAWFPMEAGN